MIGIYNDSSSTTFSVYTYGEIVWPGGSSSAGVGYYISAQLDERSSYYIPPTFSIGGSTYSYISYCRSVYGHNYSQFYFSNFDGVITEGAFSGFRGFVGPLETNATRVEYGAFAGTNLQSAYLLSTSYVGYSAFANGSIASVSLPMCETVEPYAFYSCPLPRISLPVCKSIGAYAFWSTGLSYSSSVLSLPSCETIGAYAFNNCYYIRHISLPVCRTLGNGCLAVMNLSSISLPMCEYIGEYAFARDTQLTVASIGDCSYIGNSAFYSCSNLSRVYIRGNRLCELGGSSVFYSTSNTLMIYVRSSLYSEYLSAPYWSDISGRISSF